MLPASFGTYSIRNRTQLNTPRYTINTRRLLSRTKLRFALPKAYALSQSIEQALHELGDAFLCETGGPCRDRKQPLAGSAQIRSDHRRPDHRQDIMPPLVPEDRKQHACSIG